MKIPKIKTTVYHFLLLSNMSGLIIQGKIFFGNLFIRNQVIGANPLKRIDPIS